MQTRNQLIARETAHCAVLGQFWMRGTDELRGPAVVRADTAAPVLLMRTPYAQNCNIYVTGSSLVQSL
jgi:hypothetical protein